MISIYIEKVLKQVLLVIYNGIVYIMQKDQNLEMIVKPFHFLDDMSKVVYSERHEKYFALKLRDLKKNGGRDHVVIEIGNRELLADFMIQYAEEKDDEIIFEQNEEFSMLINCSPVWFSFDDVDSYKKKRDQLLKAEGDKNLSGFLELKTSNTINYFKAIFKGG